MSATPTDTEIPWPMPANLVVAMLKAGFLDGENVELIDGRLLAIAPQGPEHRFTTHRIRTILTSVYGPEFVDGQAPVTGAHFALPEPDVYVLTRPTSVFRRDHPTGTDCRLVIEVAHSSHQRDRRKADIYASIGVPVYWMVDVKARRIEVHSRPVEGGGYGSVELVIGADLLAFPASQHSQTVASVLGD